MRILVRTIANAKKEAFEYQDVEYVRDSILVGSSSKSTVLLEGNGVLPNHAMLSLRRDGTAQIKADSGAEVKVNDIEQRRAVLRVGDRIMIATHQLRVIEAPHGFDLALALVLDESVEQTSGAKDRNLEFPLGAMTLKDAGLGRRPWAWFLMMLVFICGFAIPFADSLMGSSVSATSGIANHKMAANSSAENKFSLEYLQLPFTDSIWISGPLHSVHRTPELRDNCGACHQSAFVSVEDKACLDCHEAPEHAVNPGHENAFSELNCIGCHREHNEPSHLIREDEALCVDCHVNLADVTNASSELENVSGFDTHPELKISLLQPSDSGWNVNRFTLTDDHLKEQSNLAFSHLQHLNPDGIDGPDGVQTMACIDCHQPEQNGKLMQPITMEQHCSGCHSLAFEPTDSERQVPHDEPAKVLRALEEYYARLYAIQGGPVESVLELSRPAQRPGKPPKSFYAAMKAWADDKALDAATTLMEESACQSCHQVSINEGKLGAERWTVLPVRLSKVWMPKATFDHSAHDSMECAGCHEAEKSEVSSDIIMPYLNNCKQCHGGEKSTMMVATGCVGCHGYHAEN